MSSSVLFDAPGPKARTRHRVLSLIALAVLVGLVVLALLRLDERGELEAAKWTRMFTRETWEFYFLPGLVKTLQAAGVAVVLSALLGLILGVGRLSSQRAVRWVSGAVVEFFRGIPVLVMMIAFFYFLALNKVFAPETNPYVAVVAALTLYNGAVIAELVRSGVSNLPAGQAEAGMSVGLSPRQTMLSIQLPQAITAMLPALVSQLVVILKDTALGAIITYDELLLSARNLASGGNTLQPLVTVAVLFIVINLGLSALAGLLERRINRRGRTTGTADAQTTVPVAGGDAAR